ncbi:DUF3549 family protein [Halomonas chromatireducens]|uniref:DUF3549 domain-containing protein n=1 Tax=Halomonas chromatireducens TaxID=507626 RepID=A0A120JWM0_9GAMM|nr:DUF3549 family protein [Halomonas chromatireducens]AMD02169.1 hypothetical protein LOKO_03122 [Halomonas chromatireducens]
MQPIHTLHDFFVRTGAEVRAYHLGRRVESCSLETLAEFEAGELPWPYPWQSQARISLVFRLGDVSDPLIWFLALPLDEQGQLVPASRDAFLQRLLETLGRSVQQVGRSEPDESIENLMKDNPLAFTPSLHFQAMLHARASHDMGKPASPHLEPVEAYLSGQQVLDWRALGLQGLADFAIRLDEEASQELAGQLSALPHEVFTSLCYCLEHVDIPDTLALAIQDRGESAAADGEIEAFCACVRAISGAAMAGEWFDTLLEDSNACGPDLLAAMVGRGWRHLEHAERLPRFLTRLAETPQADFAAVARDLAVIPRLRLPVLMALREAAPDSAIGRRLAGLGH